MRLRTRPPFLCSTPKPPRPFPKAILCPGLSETARLLSVMLVFQERANEAPGIKGYLVFFATILIKSPEFGFIQSIDPKFFSRLFELLRFPHFHKCD